MKDQECGCPDCQKKKGKKGVSVSVISIQKLPMPKRKASAKSEKKQ